MYEAVVDMEGGNWNELRGEGQSMKQLERGERGFTLVEVLIVLIILGVLAGVVTLSVVGLMGKGEKETYDVDERTIQTAVSIFYADKHAYSGTDGGWNEAGSYTAVDNYPTASGHVSTLYHGNETLLNGHKVYMLMDGTDGSPADAAEIQAAAIWMSLLVSGPGDGDVSGAGPDEAPGDANSPLADEHGPYFNRLPSSCSTYNSSRGTGNYTWIVGAYGRVYGVFEEGGVWYAGFSGRYP